MSRKNPTPDTGVVGRRIVEVRKMTDAECRSNGWATTDLRPPPAVLVLDDGTTLYPSRDTEGNGPGVLFGVDPKGKGFLLL